MDANCQTNQQDFVSLAPFIFSATIVTCTVGSFGQRIIDFYLLSISKLKRYLCHLRNSFSQFANNFEPNGLKKSDPPFNLTIMKGSRYVILERGFANFTLKVRKGKVGVNRSMIVMKRSNFLWLYHHQSKIYLNQEFGNTGQGLFYYIAEIISKFEKIQSITLKLVLKATLFPKGSSSTEAVQLCLGHAQRRRILLLNAVNHHSPGERNGHSRSWKSHRPKIGK